MRQVQMKQTRVGGQHSGNGRDVRLGTAPAAAPRGGATRSAFVTRPWSGSPIPVMPAIGAGHTAPLANGARRLKERST